MKWHTLRRTTHHSFLSLLIVLLVTLSSSTIITTFTRAIEKLILPSSDTEHLISKPTPLLPSKMMQGGEDRHLTAQPIPTLSSFQKEIFTLQPFVGKDGHVHLDLGLIHRALYRRGGTFSPHLDRLLSVDQVVDGQRLYHRLEDDDVVFKNVGPTTKLILLGTRYGRDASYKDAVLLGHNEVYRMRPSKVSQFGHSKSSDTDGGAAAWKVYNAPIDLAAFKRRMAIETHMDEMWRRRNVLKGRKAIP